MPFTPLWREGKQSAVLAAAIPETKQERFFSAYEKKAKALRRALDRVAAWELPGKEFVVEYLRDM